MAKAKQKNTRLFYTDEKHIKMYEALPAQQFKELIMAMLTYKYGDNGFVDTIQDPMVKTLFIGEKVDIDRNEEEWIRRKEIYKQNGSKGGRPPIVQEHIEGMDEWLNDIEKEKGGSAYTAFEKEWNKYFDNREDAVYFVKDEMVKRKKHVNL